jgi:hypothetical protein
MVFFIPSLLLAAYLAVVSCFCRPGDTQCMGFITTAFSLAIAMTFMYRVHLMFWHIYQFSTGSVYSVFHPVADHFGVFQPVADVLHPVASSRGIIMGFFIPSLLLAGYLVVVSCFCRLGAELSALASGVVPRDFSDVQCVGFITTAFSVAIAMTFMYVVPLMFWHIYQFSAEKDIGSVNRQAIVYMTRKQILNRLKTGKLRMVKPIRPDRRKKTVMLLSCPTKRDAHRLLLLPRKTPSGECRLLLLPDRKSEERLILHTCKTNPALDKGFLTWRWCMRIFAVNCYIAYSILFAMRVRCLLALEPRYTPLIV